MALNVSIIILMRKFSENEVVFIRKDQNTTWPAKIGFKSSYGTYKVKAYGQKLEEYASEYLLIPYSEKSAELALKEMSGNKKAAKFLKLAKKDHEEFVRNRQENPKEVKQNQFCKEEERSIEESLDGEEFKEVSKKNQLISKAEAIERIKIKDLIENIKSDGSMVYSYSYKDENSRVVNCRDKIKFLLMKKLEWALQDVYFEQKSQTVERVIEEIIEADILEPVDYICSPIYQQLIKAIPTLAKMKRKKFKNYLCQKEEIILKGIENYLTNYTLFIRAEQNFINQLESV